MKQCGEEQDMRTGSHIADNTIIKSEVAKKALEHIIRRAEQFNNRYYPYKITSIGVGGSCLRSEKPKDIDIFIEGHAIPGIWEEWQDFTQLLNSNLYELYKLTYEKPHPDKKTSMRELIQIFRDKLLALGFSDHQIDSWLKWCRISDITWGVTHPGGIIKFSDTDLLERYLKEGWKGKRLEMHEVLYDPEGRDRGAGHNLHFIVFWSSKKGHIKPAEQEVENYFINEHAELTKVLNNLLTAAKAKEPGSVSLDFPIIHQHTLFFLKEKDEHIKFKKTKKALLKIARAEIKKLKTLKHEQKPLPELNTQIRASLKKFALIGIFHMKLEAITEFECKDISTSTDIQDSLSNILTRRLRGYGYQKKDIKSLVKEIGEKTITSDFMEYLLVKIDSFPYLKEELEYAMKNTP